MIYAIPFPPISSEIFSIEIGDFAFALRWYALAYIGGLTFGWWLANRIVARAALWSALGPPVTRVQIEDIMTWMVLGVVLGGRLGYVIFYQPVYYLSHPFEILMVWQGGMSFHGGFLGVVFAVWLYARKHGLALGSVADLTALVVPPGLFLGRVANFINAELWGRPTDLPWGVIFPGEMAQACGNVAGLCARHPSQLYEALLEGVLLFAVMMYLALRRRWLHHPWALTAVFLMGYGLARTIVEGFRQADAQYITVSNPMGHVLRLGEYGLTMGQMLSLPMFFVGAALLFWALRRGPAL